MHTDVRDEKGKDTGDFRNKEYIGKWNTSGEKLRF